MVLLLSLSFTGCKTPTENTDSTVKIANPIESATAETVKARFNVMLASPQGATEPVYTIINGTDQNMAQLTFNLNGAACTLRVMNAKGISDISGMYYEWTSEKSCDISGCPGEVHYIQEEQGICLWYDAASGLLYCVAVDTGATETILVDLAASLYKVG
jgi:hypothetical protein